MGIYIVLGTISGTKRIVGSRPGGNIPVTRATFPARRPSLMVIAKICKKAKIYQNGRNIGIAIA
jgi:hypothetical protein